MALPHEFKRIRLSLARSKEFPTGSERHGYEFVAPLDAKGHIDPKLSARHREHCGVRRFWGIDDETGHLVHKPGGAEHARWVFQYNPAPDDDDEAGYRFGSHVFAPGEYVSIRDHDDDEIHTFRVASVETAQQSGPQVGRGYRIRGLTQIKASDGHCAMISPFETEGARLCP